MKNVSLMIKNLVQYEQDQSEVRNEKFSNDTLESKIFQVMYEKIQRESDEVLKDTALEIVKMLKEKGII